MDKSQGAYNSFTFRFFNNPETPSYQINTLGWQMRTDTSYQCSGMAISSPKRHCIFQYTLSGCGMMDLEGTSYPLNAGDAFLVEIPGNYCYYLPESSKHWEFIFISFYGTEILKHWRSLINTHGNIFSLNINSQAITFLWELYWNAVNQSITDGYETSAMAYRFIMELYRSFTIGLSPTLPKANNDIVKAIEFMKNNFHLQISIEDVAKVSGMSRFHFTRVFTKSLGMTPNDYLTRLRLKKAVQLLQTDGFTIEKTAKTVGYSCANYFNKVFRKHMGCSPGKFHIHHFDLQNLDVEF